MTNGGILIIDDERNIRLTLRAALEGLGAEVREAPDGERGLAEFRRLPADVVLLDLRMPGPDGLTVLRTLRREAPSARVVVITAHGTTDAAVEAMKAGAADFLQKPFDPTGVRRVVESLLKCVPAQGGSGRGASAADRVADARMLARAGRLDDAERAARDAAGAAPADADPLFLLGVVADLRGARLPAQAYYRAAIGLRATFEHAHRNLARSVESRGDRPLLFGDEAVDPRAPR